MTTGHTERAAHWQNVYQAKADRETSWYQEEPTPSLDLVRAYAPPGGRVVDIGGGSSVLAARLAAEGFDVTVLDVSAAAIDRAKSRAGPLAQRVRWIVGDVTEIKDLGEFDLWHDRAVFHFLIGSEDRRAYVALAARSVRPGGHAVIGTFALRGPERCSGLAVERYDRSRLASEFGLSFTIVHSLEDTHVTPWGKPQEFFFAVMQRTALRTQEEWKCIE
jgi:2-polyprenyl-3-methyl-5-hydroxy-6-metoxy-1,4-benzoquinol methylase